MPNRLKAAVICLFGALMLMMPVARADTPADAATALTRQFYDALLSSMKQGQTLSFDARRASLDPVIRKTFDLDLMIHLAVGPAWNSLGAKDRAALQVAFANWTIDTYASRFSSYNGERFDVGKVTDGGKGTLVVHTTITPRGDAPVALGYRVLKGRVIDIYLNDSISQLAVWRGEFSSVLKRKGVDGLLARIHELAAKAAAGQSG